MWNSILRREGLLTFRLISRACSVELSLARKYLHDRHAIQDWTQAGNCLCKRQRNRTTILVHLMFHILPGQPEVKGKLPSSSMSKDYFMVSVQNERLGKPCENTIQTSPGQYPSKAQGFSCPTHRGTGSVRSVVYTSLMRSRWGAGTARGRRQALGARALSSLSPVRIQCQKHGGGGISAKLLSRG